MLNILEHFLEVDESIIEEAAEMIGGDNAFSELLDRGNEFRRANTEPIYLMSPDQSVCFVTSSDTRDIRRLH